MNTVLITGLRGFIGCNVAKYFFQKKWKIYGIGRASWAADEPSLAVADLYHKSNITLEALEQINVVPELIVHCAGTGAVSSSFDTPYEAYNDNVITTSSVLEFMRRHCRDAVLVLASSAAVYGNALFVPISEEVPENPVSPYGMMKQQAEQLCLMYGKFFGVKSARVRLFSVYGPCLQKQILWDVCQKIQKGQPNFYGTGVEMRDFIHVVDVSGLLYKAQDAASIVSPVINGGTGVGTTIKSLVDMIVLEFGIDIHPHFSGSDRAGDPPAYVASIAKALSLGWKPQNDIKSGVKEYVSWFRSVSYD